MWLLGKTLFITGALCGMGLAIAKRAAADSAHTAITAKTTKPRLLGTAGFMPGFFVH